MRGKYPSHFISKHISRLRILDLKLVLAQLPRLTHEPLSLWVFSLPYPDIGLLHNLTSQMMKMVEATRCVFIVSPKEELFTALKFWFYNFIRKKNLPLY